MKDYRWLNLGPIKAKTYHILPYHNWKPDAVLINYGTTGPLTGTMTGGGAVVTDEKVEVDSTPLPDRGSAALQPHYIPVCRVYLLEETDLTCPTCAHGALKGQWTCEGKAILYRCTYCGRHFMTMDRG